MSYKYYREHGFTPAGACGRNDLRKKSYLFLCIVFSICPMGSQL